MSQIWVLAFFAGVQSILVGACSGPKLENIDTTGGQLKLDSEVAIIKKATGLEIKRIARLVPDPISAYPEQIPVYEGNDDGRFNITNVRLSPGKYQIYAQYCYGFMNAFGQFNVRGCALIFTDLDLEAGHIYLLTGSMNVEGTFSWTETATVTAWIEDITIGKILVEDQTIVTPNQY